MNSALTKPQSDVLLALARAPYSGQRALAADAGLSLGKANETLRTLLATGYLNSDYSPAEPALHALAAAKPQRAIILAAGSGLRMAPLSDLPKGLLMVRGERLIDRLVRQLHEAGVTDITVMTGFMKERYEYLRNRGGVRLIYNADYTRKNNLHTLCLAADRLENCYIVPSDLWFADNPFSERELYSWYLLSREMCPEGEAVLTRRLTLCAAPDGENGYPMVGLSYLTGETARQAASALRERDGRRRCQRAFWESILLEPPCVTVYGRFCPEHAVYEIDTFEQLRALDYNADQLSSAALDAIHDTLGVRHEEIRDVAIMKKGMTNRSFLFTAGGKRYIMRIPGEGSNVMIDRAHEAGVYEVLSGRGIADEIVHIDAQSGYKITAFWEGARVCDPLCDADVAACMRALRRFHALNLSVEHVFDLFERIDFYEGLRGEPSVFDDYAETKAAVCALRPYLERNAPPFSLTHIDAVPDNFLFVGGEIRLIDWEYASMQDPRVDIAMFAVYAMYDRARIDRLIDAYYPEGCDPCARAALYAYVAVCGLLWSNWCEYKRTLGVEFGEYALAQYRYAKEYVPVARAAFDKIAE